MKDFSVGQIVRIKEYGLDAKIISKRESEKGDYHVYRVRRLTDIEAGNTWERYYRTDELEAVR